MKRTELRLTSLLLAGMLLFSAAAAEAAELKLPSSLSVIGEEAFFGDVKLSSIMMTLQRWNLSLTFSCLYLTSLIAKQRN